MMKKIISLLGIIMTFAVAMSVFAGCGGNKSAAKTVESLSVTQKTILVTESEKDIKLAVRIKYADEDERAATSEDVEYSSSNAQVATVSKDGVVTVTGVGNTKITVKSKSGGTTGEKLMETIDMTVVRDSSVVESLTVTGGTEQTATYKVDETLQLETKIKYVGGTEQTATNADVTYVSSEPSIATVSSSGLVSIKAVGTTEITVSSIYNNVSGAKVIKVITLNVAEAPLVTESLTLTSEKSYSMYRDIIKYNPYEEGYVDNKTQITFNVKYHYEDEVRAGNSDEATYTSSDPGVASVSDSGEITFNAIGKCTITVTSKYKTIDGKTVSVNIPVEVKRPESILPYLEIISWRVKEGAGPNGTPGVYVTFKNNSEDEDIFYHGHFDVYCLDKAGNIIGYFHFAGAYCVLDPQARMETNYPAIGYVPESTVKMVLLKVKER